MTGCVLTDVDQMFVEAPQAKLLTVRLVEQSDDGARVEVVVSLTNRAEVPLPLLDSSCSMLVASKGPHRTSDDPNQVLPALGSQTLIIPLAFASDAPEVSGKTYSLNGSVTYEPPGEIRKLLTESGIPLPQVQFAGRGKIE